MFFGGQRFSEGIDNLVHHRSTGYGVVPIDVLLVHLTGDSGNGQREGSIAKGHTAVMEHVPAPDVFADVNSGTGGRGDTHLLQGFGEDDPELWKKIKAEGDACIIGISC